MIVARSDRILLRRFRPDSDAAGFHALNADPAVIAHTGDPPFPDAAAARDFLRAYDHYDRHGYGRWAVELRETGEFAGFCGLKRRSGGDEVDLGFRLHRRLWGRGLATEAGRLALEAGFGRYDLAHVVGRAMAANAASHAVLRKLGFRVAGDLPAGDGPPGDWRRYELARADYRGGVHLRDITEADFPELFAQQRDPVAVRMAAFTAEDPDDEAAFRAKMGRILDDPTNTMRAVVADGRLAGNIGAFDMHGEREVCYWIDRACWGRGIATRALRAFLCEHAIRPIGARVVHDNAGSLRVLERCGFVVVGEDRGYAPGRGEEVREFVLRLAADAG